MRADAMASTDGTARLRCFTSVERGEGLAAGSFASWTDAWRARLNASPLMLRDDRQEALSRVVPLLVCGEQSAIAVFGTAASRHSSNDVARLHAAFHAIERDEAGHEICWQTLFEKLPRPHDLTSLRRSATLFFAGLGRVGTIADHFAQIAQLDSAVGIMMWHLERSEAVREPRIVELAARVKHDEARHVSVSRSYARLLGVSRARYEELGLRIRVELIALLQSVACSLEGIGIDPDVLFRRILIRDRDTISRIGPI